MTISNRFAWVTGQRLWCLKNRKFCNWKSSVPLAVIVACVFASVTLSSLDVFAQSNDKGIGVFPDKSFLQPQIKFKKVKVGATEREITEVRDGEARKTLDEGFQDASDWLNRTSFQMENVSGKSIVYLKVNVLFPETKASGSLMAYALTFGSRPGSKFQSGDPFLFKPNDSLDVALGPKYSDMTRFIGARTSIESIHHIQLEVSFIVFDDGAAWSAGSFMRQDPTNPDRYIPVEQTVSKARP